MLNINEIIKILIIHNWYDWLVLIIPIITVIINVLAVNINTNKQIANQNKQTYKPRLRLKKVQIAHKNNSEPILYAYSKYYSENEPSVSEYFEITLENIGNGLANDLSFYTLTSGKRCSRFQIKDYDKNQILSSTIEISTHGVQKLLFCINFNEKIINSKNDPPNNEDSISLICNYKDLNNNNYKIIIGIIVKSIMDLNINENEYYDHECTKIDYYYFQEKTNAFNNTIKNVDHKSNYKKILSEIKKSK